MGLAFIVPDVNFSNARMGKVHLIGDRPLMALSIMGPNDVRLRSQFSVVTTPYNSTQRDIQWSITTGGSYATITQNGVVEALPGANNSEVVIAATSVDNPDIQAEKNIRVTYTSGEVTILKNVTAGVGRYVDTGIIPANGQTLRIQIRREQNGVQAFFGTRNGQASYNPRCDLFLVGNALKFATGDPAPLVTTTYEYQQGTMYIVRFQPVAPYAQTEGYGSMAGNFQGVIPGGLFYPLYLFNINCGGVLDSDITGGCTIGFFQILNGDTLLHVFLSALISNEVKFYDTVTQQVYDIKGSGIISYETL